MISERSILARALAAVLACLLLGLPARALDALQDELPGLELEQLLELEVTSVSKRRERLFQAAAAIAVITHEDIARPGVQSLPEALRAVPGMEVARINANKWAVSSRGFNARFANELQVLQDGRGPGAVLWGANAVNGVVNIVTRGAEDTLGGLVYGTVGTEEHGARGARYGFQLEEDLVARVYVKDFNRDDFSKPSGGNAGDERDMARGGFRADWLPAAEDHLTLQGDAYAGEISEEPVQIRPAPPFVSMRPGHQDVSGGNLLACLGGSVARQDQDATPAPAAPRQRPASEARVKAAFVYQFLRHCSWPATSFRRADTPLVVLVFGSGAIDANLKRLDGRKVHGRKIVVRKATRPKEVDGAHAIVISSASSAKRARILDRVGKRAVLTIGDGKAFCLGRGVIAFEVLKRRVRFHLNLLGARKAGLKIHPKLLKLASSVRGGKSR